MSIGSNVAENGIFLIKVYKKKLRIGPVAILSLNAADIRMNLNHKYPLV